MHVSSLGPAFPVPVRRPGQFERNLIRESTVAGLTAARARGRKGGRPPKLSAKEVRTIRALLKTADIPVAEIAARFGIAHSTLYRTILEPAAGHHGAFVTTLDSGLNLFGALSRRPGLAQEVDPAFIYI
jgi:hypothetical protein